MRPLVIPLLLAAALPARAAAPEPAPPAAAEAEPAGELDVGAFMAGYARDPQPGRLADLLLRADRLGVISDDTAGPLAAFAAAVLREHPARAPALARRAAEGSAQCEALFWQAVWLAGTPETAAALLAATSARLEVRATLEALRAQPPPILLGLPLDAPGVLDLLWSTYLASGDPRYVVRIASALDLVDSEDAGRRLVGEAARWSLRANLEQDPAVRRALEAAVAAGGAGADPARVRAVLAAEGPVGPPGR